MFKTNFLSFKEANSIAATHATPLFVYSAEKLKEQATLVQDIPAPYGLTIRYAMKANPHPEVLRVFREQGITIDASSGYEAAYAIEQGFAAKDVLLTSQQLAHNLVDLVQQGVEFTATSLRQLTEFGKAFPGHTVGVRLNPGIGSGHSMRTNVGGTTSSFGIWHEYIAQIHAIAAEYDLSIARLHTHIGSGTDPEVWKVAAHMSLQLAKEFPDVSIIDLGGGFKVGRLDDERSADMKEIGQVIADELRLFERETGRRLHLELEPGTFLVANAGVLLTKIDDIVDTGPDGFTFLKLDTGMNDILRPSLYGAQHPVAVLNQEKTQKDYVVVGHNCESGDLLTPAPGDPETLGPRTLNEASIGDLVAIGGTGAYCASMAAHGYNSFPSAKGVML